MDCVNSMEEQNTVQNQPQLGSEVELSVQMRALDEAAAELIEKSLKMLWVGGLCFPLNYDPTQVQVIG